MGFFESAAGYGAAVAAGAAAAVYGLTKALAGREAATVARERYRPPSQQDSNENHEDAASLSGLASPTPAPALPSIPPGATGVPEPPYHIEYRDYNSEDYQATGDGHGEVEGRVADVSTGGVEAGKVREYRVLLPSLSADAMIPPQALGRFTEERVPEKANHVKLKAVQFPSDGTEGEKALYAMAMVERFTFGLKAAQSAKHPFVLRGNNEAPLKYIFAALMIVGKCEPNAVQIKSDDPAVQAVMDNMKASFKDSEEYQTFSDQPDLMQYVNSRLKTHAFKAAVSGSSSGESDQSKPIGPGVNK